MNPGAGTLSFPKLHHTGLLVRDLEESARHYASSLGYRVESAVIEDPIQTARVMFLRLPHAHHWLELVAPSGPSSKLAGGLAKGGGLHHLCHEVGDLAATLEHCRSHGYLLISEPVPAVAFPGRKIAWVMDRNRLLLELLEAAPGPLSLSSLNVSTLP